MYERRCPLPEDAAFFCGNMKSIDMAKAAIFNDKVNSELIQSFIDDSDYCQVLVAGGFPFCIYGCIPDGKGGAWTWACTTDALYCHSKYFLAVSYEEMKRFKAMYNSLCNFGLAKHEKAIHWAEKLGYEQKFEKEFGGEKFIFMKWER